jgi:HTH-type transcriptional regulator, sugar sensing transcriptional regulator
MAKMSDAVDLLRQLGFGEYEAKAYIALLQQNPLNGYELAKTSGIPRANIYGVLQRLEERNAVIPIEMEGSLRYAPVPPEQLIPQMGAHFQNVLESTQRELAALSQPNPQRLNRNVLGYTALLDQARGLINGAQDDLFIALWHPEAQALAAEIGNVKPEVRLTTLCMQACPAECGACAGSIYRYHVVPEQVIRWLIVVRDNRDMLLGEIGPDQTVALRTAQQSLIQMTVQFFQSHIAWAAVLEHSGASLNEVLSPESLHTLKAIQPHGDQAGWLAYMRALLSQGTS